MTSGRISLLIATVLGLAGCAHSPGPTEVTRPVKLEAIPGSALHKVILTETAARHLEVRTETVRTSAGRAVIPTAAVIYDPGGASWTYLALSPRIFMRQAIGIDHVSGADTVLRSGPAAGTAVVTVGAPELLGSEYGVGEE
jgi:hypothetical protein